jgi:uncharacterized protein affecting Mg2+/Co2+ transport
MYKERTRSIQISVEPFYVNDQSAPEHNRFVFGYRVQIDNQGAETVQLVSRQWRITDGLGRTMEVRGAGVVGKQPILRPGESFEYTSGTPQLPDGDHRRRAVRGRDPGLLARRARSSEPIPLDERWWPSPYRPSPGRR